jgi:hypothetical protein
MVANNNTDSGLPVSTKNRDPNRPKRIITAYFFYGMQRKPEISRSMESAGENINTPRFKNMISAIIQEEWSVLPLSKKAIFYARQSKEEERYNSEMKIYQERINV